MQDKDLPDSYDATLDLSEVAEKYAQSVPFRFRVVNGFMAENEKDPTLGVDEVYSLHLVRKIKVVVMEHDGQEFEIPLNSTAKFGLIPSIISHCKMVEDLLKLKPLPNVISVVDKYVCPDGSRLSLGKNELLLVKEVTKGKFGHSKSGLKVFSLKLRKELVLPRDCQAEFSTYPEATKLYLTDLIDNNINFIPCKAIIYPEETSSLAGLQSSTILISKQEVHRSVVISLFRDNPYAKRKKGTHFIDVPTSINIRVSIIKTEKSDEAYGRIYKESENLLKDYNPSKIQACVDAQTDNQYMTQAQLLAETDKEKAKREMAVTAPHHYQQLLFATKLEENSYQDWTPPSQGHTPRETRPGLQLTKDKAPNSGRNSPIISPPPIPQKKAATINIEELKSRQQNLTPPHTPPPTAKPRPSAKPRATKPPPPPPYPSHNTDSSLKHQGTTTVKAVSDVLYEDLDIEPQTVSTPAAPTPAAQPAGLEEVWRKLNRFETMLSSITSQINGIHSRQDQFERKLSAMKSSEPSEQEIVIKADMKPAEVLKALDAVGLSQYKEAFSREAVDGEMFLILDDDILSTELGVKSRLHRVRLLKMKGTGAMQS